MDTPICEHLCTVTSELLFGPKCAVSVQTDLSLENVGTRMPMMLIAESGALACEIVNQHCMNVLIGVVNSTLGYGH